MSAREEILRKIGSILPPGREVLRDAEYQALPQHYQTQSNLTKEEIVAIFTDRLHDYNALVHRCTEAEVATTIKSILESRNKRNILVPEAIPVEWLPDGFEYTRDLELTYDEMDRSEGVLTDCSVAIAISGTIVVRHSVYHGRRALTLVPDYHLCVVHTSQIVETAPEGFRRIEDLLPAPLTTISGPSATSDIEMIRVKGVHGPRTLEVILVSPDP